MTTEIKIYVANLGKYTEGELVGEWFTLPHDTDDIRVKIGVAHYDECGNFVPYKDSEDGISCYEEWAIHDFESPFEIGEHDSIDNLNNIAELMADMEEYEIEACSILWKDRITGGFAETVQKIKDGEIIFHHDINHKWEIAYNSYHENYNISEMPSVLVNAIDWDKVLDEMQLELHELSGNIWVECLN